MFLRFRCGACGEPLRVREEMAARRIKCPGCGSAQKAPSAGAMTATAPGDGAEKGDAVPVMDGPSPRREQRPAATRSAPPPAPRTIWSWIVCGALGVLLAVMLPLALFGHLGARSARNELAGVREELAATERETDRLQQQLLEARQKVRESEARAEEALARQAPRERPMPEQPRPVNPEPPPAPVADKPKPAAPETVPPAAPARNSEREEKLRTALRRCGDYAPTVTSDNLDVVESVFNALGKGKIDFGDRLLPCARAIARKNPKAWFSIVLGSDGKILSLADLRELLGKEDSSAKDSIQIGSTQFGPRYLPITWHTYDWCGFGVSGDGKVVALKADCAKLSSETAAPAPVEAKGPPGGGDEVERAVQTVMAAANEGQFVNVWDALPASYRKDLSDLVHDFAGRMDPQLWARLMVVLKETGTLLETKRDDILNVFGAELSPDVVKNVPVIRNGLQAFLDSDLASLDRMKRADLRAVLKQLSLPPAGDRPDSGIKVRVLSRQGDTAKVRVELPKDRIVGALLADAGGEESDWVKVEGKWVPKEMADQWAEAVSAARKGIVSLTGELSGKSKEPVLAFLAAIADTLNNLRKTSSKDDFQLAFAEGATTITRRAQAIDVERIVNQLDFGELGRKYRRDTDQIETDIRRLRAQPGNILVVQGTDGKYRSFAVTGIKEVKGRTITLRQGTMLAIGASEGKRTREQIVGDFVRAARTNPAGGPYFVQLDKDGRAIASGVSGQIKEETTIYVKSVLGARDDK